MSTLYRYWQDGTDTILDATDEEAALEEAHDLAREGWDRCEETQIDPEEPSCVDGEDHDYEETSVRGNAGGVVYTETCARCGVVMVTDTWATDPYNGVQGCRSVRYLEPEPADDD